MNYKFTIKGTLPGLNELIEAERRNRFIGAKLKKQYEAVVMRAARSLGNVEFEEPVYMVYHWYEKDRRRDKDNISGMAHAGRVAQSRVSRVARAAGPCGCGQSCAARRR